MRIGLPGSGGSFGGGLSSLSQSGQPRSRSGTGSWSADRAASAASAASAGWPRGFVRGAGGGIGLSGCHTPPMATSTSWTKLSAATLAAQRFASCANQEQQSSPSAHQQQPSAAEIFSGSGAAALADDAAGDAAAAATPKTQQQQQQKEEEETETCSPLTLRRAYHGADGGHGGALGGGQPRPVAERRWEDGEVPFREKNDVVEERRAAALVAPEGDKRVLPHEAKTETEKTREPTPTRAPLVTAVGGVQSAAAASAHQPSRAGAAVASSAPVSSAATACNNTARPGTRVAPPRQHLEIYDLMHEWFVLGVVGLCKFRVLTFYDIEYVGASSIGPQTRCSVDTVCVF